MWAKLLWEPDADRCAFLCRVWPFLAAAKDLNSCFPDHALHLALCIRLETYFRVTHRASVLHLLGLLLELYAQSRHQCQDRSTVRTCVIAVLKTLHSHCEQPCYANDSASYQMKALTVFIHNGKYPA